MLTKLTALQFYCPGFPHHPSYSALISIYSLMFFRAVFSLYPVRDSWILVLIFNQHFYTGWDHALKKRMHVWARTTWLKQKDILFVYSDPLPSLPPPMPYQHLIFSLGPANINLISKTSVLKIYCTTQNSIKSSRRLSPRSPTNLRALDYDGSTYTAKWFTSLVHSLVLVPLSAILHMHHFVPGLWRKPSAALRGGAQAQLWGWTAQGMAEQGWGYGSFGSSCPTPPQLASCPQTPPVCPTPHPTPCSIPSA